MLDSALVAFGVAVIACVNDLGLALLAVCTEVVRIGFRFWLICRYGQKWFVAFTAKAYVERAAEEFVSAVDLERAVNIVLRISVKLGIADRAVVVVINLDASIVDNVHNVPFVWPKGRYRLQD